MKKNYVAIALIMALILVSVIGHANAAGTEKREMKLRVGDTQPNSPYEEALKMFNNLVSKATNNRITVSVHEGTLGGEKQLVEAVRLGTLDMCLVGTTYYNKIDYMYSPYLFRDDAHIKKVTEGPIGQGWRDSIRKDWGIQIIGFTFFAERHLTSNRPVRSVSDLKGLKIRVVEMDVFMKAWKALGANPTPMPFPGLYSALQQKVVDAQENPLQIIYDQKFYEVQKYITLIGYARTARSFMIGGAIWDKMHPDDQKLFTDTWKICDDFIYKKVTSNNQKYLDTFKEKGVTIIKPDLQEFRNATLATCKELSTYAWGEGSYEAIQAVK